VKESPAIPGFEFLGVLGLGGMAIVYKARQLRPRRLVAVKMIDPRLANHREVVARFRREQVVASRLRHPNLVAAYRAGRAAGRLYLVLELVRGEGLDELVMRNGPLAVADACELIRQAALGLQHLHDQGLVHRDVKPSNLMLTPSGRLKVLDLGLARDLRQPGEQDRITSYGQFLGTPDYLAPEQCLDPHAVDGRADVYSLGCTLYELLTGRPPFASGAYASAFLKMRAHVEAPTPPVRGRRPDVPERLAADLGRMLAKDREERFASPGDVAAAVRPFATAATLAGLSEAAPRAVPAA
jgi:serine/threonine protein kinase